MTVRYKKTGNIYKVYDIAYDNAGYPHFLIYANSQWIRVSAKHFEPVEEDK